MLRRCFQPAVENLSLFTAIGNHFDFAHDDVGTLRPALHTGRKRELEFPDALGFQSEL